MGQNQMALFIQEAGGLDKIENLQMHDNQAIYSKVLQIMTRYFGAEEEEDDNLAPQVSSDGQSFQFGQPQATGDSTVNLNSNRPATGVQGFVFGGNGGIMG